MSDDIQCLNGHTLMFIQFSKNEETRTYLDCKTPNEVMETFCRIYENFLLHKQGVINSTVDGEEQQTACVDGAKVEYQLEDILKFVD